MKQPIVRKLNKTEVSGMTSLAIADMVADFDAKKASLASRPKSELDNFKANVKIGLAVQAERLRNR